MVIWLGRGGSIMRIRLRGVACMLACLEGTYLEANFAHLLFPFPFPFLSCNHLHYLRPPIQNNNVVFFLIMHSRFIFLFLLHGVIANQELPLSRTDNLFPPAPDLLPVTTVASMELTATAASGSASQAFEARSGDDGEYEHHQTGQEATFPAESSYRLVFNDGVFDSVPSNAMPEEGRNLVRKYDHAHCPDDKRRDLYHENRPPLTDPPGDSNHASCRAAVGARDEYPMLHSDSQMSPRPAGIFSGEGEGMSRRSVSSTPPYPDQSHFRSLAPLDGENVFEDVGSGTNSRNEYPLFTSNIFGPVVKGPTRLVTTRSESGIKKGLDQEE